MSMAELFKTNPEQMSNLLNEVSNGDIQLPDFQRGWVWDEIRIRNLLISVVSNFPIGAAMMLDAGNQNAQFSSVVLTNVPVTNKEPKRLLLDGQQRLTSLYQTLCFSGPVDTTDTKKKEKKRYYYFCIDEMIKEDFDEENLIFIANHDKYSRKTGTSDAYDLTSIERECESGLFPTSLSMDMAAANKWSWTYTNNGQDSVRQQKWNIFFDKLIALRSYSIPVISLTKENKKEAVCSVFENVNTGGVPLNVFELLTATFAASGFRLRQDWEDVIEPSLKNSAKDYNEILADVSSVDFLQALTLLATKRRIPSQAVACKRKNILDLKLQEYQALRNVIIEGFVSAAIFLLEQRIYSRNTLPYGSQLVPLAAIFAELGPKAKIAKNSKRISQWYWCGVFGELYGGANETRFVKDYVEVVDCINEKQTDEPDSIRTSTFRADRLDEMRTKNSAAYKGVSVLLMQNGAKDFMKDTLIDSITKYNSSNIDIHHIFPADYCRKVGIPKDKYDSIINKAPLSYDTNRTIGGSAPSIYISKYLDEANGQDISNELLTSQLVDVELIRDDDFEAYYDKRKEKLIELIEVATGKRVTR
jgi:hypothetical protein